MDDPGGHSHHHDAHTLKEVQEWLPLLPAHGDGNSSDNGEDDKPQDVGAIGPVRLEHPCTLIMWVYRSSCTRVRSLQKLHF